MGDTMEDEPILERFFIKICFQYEYLKHPNSPRQAFKNLSEMLVSDIVKKEVKTKSWRKDTPEPDAPGPEYFEPGPFFPRPDPESSDDRPIIDIDSEEYDDDDEEEEESESELPDLEGGDDDVRVSQRRKINAPESSAETSIETTTPRSDLGSLLGSEDLDADSEDSMTIFPVGSSYTLLKEDEEDRLMDGIPIGAVFEFYRKCLDGYCGFDEWPSKRRKSVPLSDLRMWAFTFFRLNFSQDYKPNRLQQPFNQVKVVTDHSKIKIELSDSTKKVENLKYEYWEDEKGCLVWFNDSVRLIKDFHYETMAANEFLHIANWGLSFKLMDPYIVFEKLELDIEENKKWSPKQFHSADFYRKIKRYIRNLEKKEGMPANFLWVKHYSFKLYRFKKLNHLMLPLKFLASNCIEEITIKIWDDSHIKPSKRRFSKYLNYLDRNDQWKHAGCLNIQDPYLEGFLPDISNFMIVNMWNVTTEMLEKMREMFGKRVPQSKVITVKTGYTKQLENFGILESEE